MIKTVSLETAKLLKEEGLNKVTHFYWTHPSGSEHTWIIINGNVYEDCIEHISAPTTDELLEQISNNNLLQYWDDVMTGLTIGDNIDIFRHPEDLAKCWLWLRKEKLI